MLPEHLHEDDVFHGVEGELRDRKFVDLHRTQIRKSIREAMQMLGVSREIYEDFYTSIADIAANAARSHVDCQSGFVGLLLRGLFRPIQASPFHADLRIDHAVYKVVSRMLDDEGAKPENR